MSNFQFAFFTCCSAYRVSCHSPLGREELRGDNIIGGERPPGCEEEGEREHHHPPGRGPHPTAAQNVMVVAMINNEI